MSSRWAICDGAARSVAREASGRCYVQKSAIRCENMRIKSLFGENAEVRYA